MRLIFALIFVVGIGLAGTAVYFFKEHVADLQAQNAELTRLTENIEDSVPVIVAAKDLVYGVPLKREDVREVLFPENAIPQSSFNTVDELFGPPGTEPRTILRSMVADEVIMASKVTEFGKDAGITSRLQPGMRAFTIKVDSQSGVSGFLKPGSYVDVYWAGNVNGKLTTRLMFPNIQLIAIDQNFDEDTTKPTLARTVTAQVSPQDAARLQQAQSSGTLSLSLRGAVAADSGIDPEAEVIETQQTLLGIEEVVVEEEQKCFQRERRGVEIVEIEVPCTGN